MKKLVLAAVFAFGAFVGVEAAPTDAVTKADLQALIERIAKLEAQNQAQAKRIAELEAADKKAPVAAPAVASAGTAIAVDEGTTTNETGRIFTTSQGFKYYLADASARIFDPLSESGLRITPYGYLVLEGVYNTHGTEADIYADYVKNPNSRGYDSHTSVLSMQDSLLGIQFETPEAIKGWKFIGRAEFDLAGDHSNDYAFHWRHLYVDAQHESGWSILFGQTWHLWKIVAPSEIDGAWMENTGYPYRRSPQIRVTKKWDWEDSSFTARIGVVKNGPGMGGDRDNDSVQDNAASALPLFEAAMIYDHAAPWQDDDKRWLVGVGGQYGQDRSRGIIPGTTDFGWSNEDYDSSMILLAGELPFGDFKLAGQVFAGENLGGVQAGVGQRVMYNAYTGDGEGVRTWGGFVDLSYQITADWSAAIGYGFDHPEVSDNCFTSLGADGPDPTAITHNDRAYIDVFYQITDNFRLGLEYARLNTRYCDTSRIGGDVGGNAYSDRIQFSAFYDF